MTEFYFNLYHTDISLTGILFGPLQSDIGSSRMATELWATLEIQYIAVRYFAISSISRIVRGPQIYHDHKKKNK